MRNGGWSAKKEDKKQQSWKYMVCTNEECEKCGESWCWDYRAAAVPNRKFCMAPWQKGSGSPNSLQPWKQYQGNKKKEQPPPTTNTDPTHTQKLVVDFLEKKIKEAGDAPAA